MPAVMANPAFAKNPFATIRLHTQVSRCLAMLPAVFMRRLLTLCEHCQNTMEKAKVVPKPSAANKKR